MRLRIGVTTSLIKNALVCARNLNSQDTDKAKETLQNLSDMGFTDGLQLANIWPLGKVSLVLNLKNE